MKGAFSRRQVNIWCHISHCVLKCGLVFIISFERVAYVQAMAYCTHYLPVPYSLLQRPVPHDYHDESRDTSDLDIESLTVYTWGQPNEKYRRGQRGDLSRNRR